MVPFIMTAREHHRVKTADAYLKKHRRHLEQAHAHGARFLVHHSQVPVVARVYAGQWVVDCECGAGNATEPSWRIACCFGCGAVHRDVRFPAEWADIEAQLVARTLPSVRHWVPGEAVSHLLAENIALAEGGRL